MKMAMVMWIQSEWNYCLNIISTFTVTLNFVIVRFNIKLFIMLCKLTKIKFIPSHTFLLLRLSESALFLLWHFYARTYWSKMYRLYNIQDRNSCDTAGLSDWVLIGQWSVPAYMVQRHSHSTLMGILAWWVSVCCCDACRNITSMNHQTFELNDSYTLNFLIR
jgi:hypothetical protein